MPGGFTEERAGVSEEPPLEGPFARLGTPTWVVRYGAAVLAAGLALLLQWQLVPLFGSDPNASPFIVFFAAVMVAAWFGGLGPGLLATALSALISWYFFLSPQFSFALACVLHHSLPAQPLDGQSTPTALEATHLKNPHIELAKGDYPPELGSKLHR